jgi:WD40 repeat protein
MSTERRDLRVRAWLADRDPGEAPARLRAAVASIPDDVSQSRFPAFDSALTRLVGSSPQVRRVLVAATLVLLAVAIAGAALLLSRQPFPPRGLIAFSTPTPGVDIRVVAADGTGERSITETSAFEFDPRWSPDGRTLLFTRVSEPETATSQCEGQGSIVLYDMATSTERVLVTDPGRILAAEWDPSGDKVVFLVPKPPCVVDISSPERMPTDIIRGEVGIDDGQATTVVLGQSTTWYLRRRGDEIASIRFDLRATYSADGRRIATDMPGRELFAHVSLYDDEADHDPTDLGVGGVPVWSPTSDQVAYVEYVDAPSAFTEKFRDRIVVYDVGTRERRVVGAMLNPNVIGPGGAIIPLPVSWTPDGRSIFWLDVEGGHIVDVSGERSADLPTALEGCGDMQWQPLPDS